MKIKKLINKNVVLTDDTGFILKLFQQVNSVDVVNDDTIIVKDGSNHVTNILVSQITATQVLPAVESPFVGNALQLMDLLSLYFFTNDLNSTSQIEFLDTPNFDAFSRFRISQPLGLFNSQFTYDLQPLLYEQIVDGVGASISWGSNDKIANMQFLNSPASSSCYMQSYEYIPYQPGKSQLIFITFNFQGNSVNTQKFAGYCDGDNGIELFYEANKVYINLYSQTLNGNQSILQNDWNIDKFDGTGPSGAILNTTKVQILVIDFQALYAGRVRVGFDIDGIIYYAHEFYHSNIIEYPYISRASLPIRVGMKTTGISSAKMYFLCSSVISEGGNDDSERFSYSFAQTASISAASATRTHLISMRPQLLFGGVTNRNKIQFTGFELLVTGNHPVKWELCLGQSITTTTPYASVDTYSCMEYNSTDTLTGTAFTTIDEGYIASQGSSKSILSADISARYPITLSALGSHRALGTMTVVVTGIGGASQCYGSLKFREIR